MLTPAKTRYVLFASTSGITCSSHHQGSSNIFDNLPSLSRLHPTTGHNELDVYLATSVEDIAPGDTLKWWQDHSSLYPCLSHMALDYLTIPGTCLLTNDLVFLIYCVATSVEVECLFSKGCVILPYLHNCLSSQSTHALLCLGQWSKLSLVKDVNIRKATCDEEETADGEV